MTLHDKIRLWFSIVSQIHHETNGFKLDISKLSTAEIANLKPVDISVIEMAPLAVKAVHPKQRASVKRAIVYLTDLRERQSVAWAEFIQQLEKETANG
jgi:hypothetical protein